MDADTILTNAAKAQSTTVEGTTIVRRSVKDEIAAVEFAERQANSGRNVFGGIARAQFRRQGPEK